MPLPVITFNSSTGSDTAASGSGGTAITAGGNNSAATTAASANVDLSADAPDLSGVATDGSAVLWVGSSSGRQWSAITAVDNGTKIVTCEDTFANTESARSWGIGGKRATIGAASSRTLLSATTTGAKSGWTVVLEDNQSISTTAWTNAVVGITIRGDSETSHRQILQTSIASVISNAGNAVFKNIKMANSNATKTGVAGILGNATCRTLCVNCIFGDVTNTLLLSLARNGGSMSFSLINCEIGYCTTSGFALASVSYDEAHFDGCWIHDNVSHGLSWSSDATNGLEVRNCIIEDNGADGINVSVAAQDRLIVTNCTIDGNTGDGIDISTAAVAPGSTIMNNNFTGNGGYGINGHSTLDAIAGFIDYNNYGSGAGIVNTLGARNNLTAGPNDLSVDPSYANAASNDFSVGTSVKAKGYPVGGTTYVGANKSTTYSYIDTGASQRVEAGSGGGGPLIGGRLAQ